MANSHSSNLSQGGLTFRGETKPLIEWARIYDINPVTLAGRLNRGWPLQKALTKPVKYRTCLGKKYPKEYRAWKGLRSRCSNKRQKGYKNYGGRGVKVCERWDSFANFLADVGPCPSPKHTIERINNDGNYEPDNCRWDTRKAQSRNRRGRLMLTFQGETLPAHIWAERTGISLLTIMDRTYQGWPAERTLTVPPLTERYNSRRITFRGETKTVQVWAKEVGLPCKIIRQRMNAGWDAERILTTPIAPRTKRR